MENIPTAEEFLINKLEETQPNENRPPKPKEVEEWLIEFAKLHATEALKQASDEAQINHIDYGRIIVDKDSILNAYDLNNIK